MRVISGQFKGRRLAEPKTMDIRPTTDRTKEALFNIINFNIEGSSFLDLFSGAGGIAIEAYSRGANKVVAVDNSKESERLFKVNNNKMNTEIEFYNNDVTRYLEMESNKYDYIFLDPPYDMNISELESILNLCIKCLVDNAKLILEFSTYNDLNFEKLSVERKQKYGKSTLYFLKEK